MGAATRTKTDIDLESRIAACGSDGERAEVLRRARRFKASWVELGESLSQVMAHDRWKGWGYASFDDYCRKELHLKKETAYKLTGSFTFLRNRAPEVLERDGMRGPIPSFESVDFWRRAEEDEEAEEVPAETRHELRRAVVDDLQPPAALKRRYQEVFFPTDEEDRTARERAALLAAARRLVELLAGSRGIPRKLAEEVEEQVERLVQTLTR